MRALAISWPAKEPDATWLTVRRREKIPFTLAFACKFPPGRPPEVQLGGTFGGRPLPDQTLMASKVAVAGEPPAEESQQWTVTVELAPVKRLLVIVPKLRFLVSNEGTTFAGEVLVVPAEQALVATALTFATLLGVTAGAAYYGGHRPSSEAFETLKNALAAPAVAAGLTALVALARVYRPARAALPIWGVRHTMWKAVLVAGIAMVAAFWLLPEAIFVLENETDRVVQLSYAETYLAFASPARLVSVPPHGFVTLLGRFSRKGLADASNAGANRDLCGEGQEDCAIDVSPGPSSWVETVSLGCHARFWGRFGEVLRTLPTSLVHGMYAQVRVKPDASCALPAEVSLRLAGEKLGGFGGDAILQATLDHDRRVTPEAPEVSALLPGAQLVVKAVARRTALRFTVSSPNTPVRSVAARVAEGQVTLPTPVTEGVVHVTITAASDVDAARQATLDCGSSGAQPVLDVWTWAANNVIVDRLRLTDQDDFVASDWRSFDPEPWSPLACLPPLPLPRWDIFLRELAGQIWACKTGVPRPLTCGYARHNQHGHADLYLHDDGAGEPEGALEVNRRALSPKMRLWVARRDGGPPVPLGELFCEPGDDPADTFVVGALTGTGLSVANAMLAPEGGTPWTSHWELDKSAPDQWELPWACWPRGRAPFPLSLSVDGSAKRVTVDVDPQLRTMDVQKQTNGRGSLGCQVCRQRWTQRAPSCKDPAPAEGFIRDYWANFRCARASVVTCTCE